MGAGREGGPHLAQSGLGVNGGVSGGGVVELRGRAGVVEFRGRRGGGGGGG